MINENTCTEISCDKCGTTEVITDGTDYGVPYKPKESDFQYARRVADKIYGWTFISSEVVKIIGASNLDYLDDRDYCVECKDTDFAAEGLAQEDML